ncbi:tRNA A64-2'-O-ribosylphosphate transferase [Ascoidea rubescens DSM 1968]|uniref:Initiator tRNA phosphoribosyl transferase n=1 Tax=Ascoidea rubescens DSM 1968 TaxID=1344418 RepID=A0A1D2VAJ6_9ASCO|nr:initiator tRNA phosphoribosyl transferase [Ascoidea rubescens DSM 1968]ODV58477.1 initiator tRNA phosphoribosyl transferase [Ascoidea rubescens DSM 1968]
MLPTVVSTSITSSIIPTVLKATTTRSFSSCVSALTKKTDGNTYKTFAEYRFQASQVGPLAGKPFKLLTHDTNGVLMENNTLEISDLLQNDCLVSNLDAKTKKTYKTIKDRIYSILKDVDFILAVANLLSDYPLIANERCGSWYIPNHLLYDTCYFKSTDSHINEWDFSLRRLNLHLLDIIKQKHGIIIIDSTRSTKKKVFPDSLSKTIPIWCAVLNYIRFSDKNNINKQINENYLFLPKSISKFEYDNIYRLIPKFTESLLSLDIISSERLIQILGKRLLKPIFIFHDISLDQIEDCFSDNIYPIYLVCASKIPNGGDCTRFYNYIPGAADDHELWCPSSKFSSKIFWDNIDKLKDQKLSENDLIKLINFLSNGDDNNIVMNYDVNINELGKSIDNKIIDTNISTQINKINENIIVGKISFNSDIEYGHLNNYLKNNFKCYNLVIILTENIINIKNNNAGTTKNENKRFPYYLIDEDKTKLLILPLSSSNKAHSKKLRYYFPIVFDKLKIISIKTKEKVLILDEDGKDLGIAFGLICLIKYFSPDDIHRLRGEEIEVNKDLVKKYLAQIIGIVHKANPRRATLLSINYYFMSK